MDIDNLLITIRNWRFTPGVTPFTSWPYPFSTIALYLLLVYLIPRLMTNRKPLELPNTIYLHNLLLSISSFVLGTILLTILTVKHASESLSFFDMICSKQMHEDGRLHIIYTINHVFKYIELFDTILLSLRKKAIPFLHTYHHAATLFLTWSQLVEHSTVQWVPILLNLWVHVAMYYYYAITAKGKTLWWKKYLTTAQIMQFVLDMIVIGYAYGIYIFSGFKGCYGTDTGAVTGIMVLFSYLVLFVRFYIKTYSTKSKTPKKGVKIEDAIGKKQEKKD